MKRKDSIGKTFGHLTILEVFPNDKVKCQCACGTLRLFNWRDIRRGRTKGCGCRRNTPELRALAKDRAIDLQKKGILKRGYIAKDAKCPFKYILRMLNRPNRKPCNLEIEDLKKAWEKSGGACAYTKIKLILPIGSANPNPVISYKMASIDRIDSSKGYIKGNIQYVSRNINYAKGILSHQEMLDFVDLIKKDGREGLI
jgi:hypothetical protein